MQNLDVDLLMQWTRSNVFLHHHQSDAPSGLVRMGDPTAEKAGNKLSWAG